MALTNPPLSKKGAGPIPDASALQETIQGAKLPSRRPDNMWAGRSNGGDCAICGTALERGEMEYELEYFRNDTDPGVDAHRVHIRCFTARIWKVQGPKLRRS